MTAYSKTTEGETLVYAIRELLGEDPTGKTGATLVSVRPYVYEYPDGARRYCEALREVQATRISASEFFALPDTERGAMADRRETAEAAIQREQKAFDAFTEALVKRIYADMDAEQEAGLR